MKVVKLVAPLALGCNQPGRFEQFKMLRDTLAGSRDLVLHRQAGAQLEQRLAIPLGQFVEDRPPYWR